MFPIIEIFEQQIYSYPLLMGMAWGIAYQLSQYLNIKYRVHFPKLNLFFWGAFAMSWIGAKVFFILTTTIDKELLLENSNFWLGGGFVFYGGLIFGGIYCLSFIRLNKIEISKTNIFLPALAIGHSIGRIGCFLAGCCFGKETDHFLSVHMHNAQRYPVQIYESFGLLLIGVFLWKRGKNNTSILFHYVFAYSILRFLLEFLRGDKIRGIYLNFVSTSQIISILLIIISTILILALKRATPTKVAGI